MQDYLTELGLLSLGSRFKRLSDLLYHEMAAFYRSHGITFDPGNFPLIHYLHQHPSPSIGDVAEALGISQAAVSQKTASLRASGLIRVGSSKTDRRKSTLQLTPKGQTLLKKLLPCWQTIEHAMAQHVGEHTTPLLQAIAMLEDGIHRGALRKKLEAASAAPFKIVPFSKKHAPTFDRLNRAWIEEFFFIEPLDEQVLTQPKKMILDTGGEVWFAERDGKAIGTYALFTLREGMYEFTKLGVDESARGMGVARALLRHGAARAKARGAHTLRIFTSTRLVPACTLYRAEGFKEVKMTAAERKRYKRADIMFDLPL